MPQEIARQWFVPGDGIDRHVISADIQRYLGNDATVRPGQGTGDHQVRLFARLALGLSYLLCHRVSQVTGSRLTEISPLYVFVAHRRDVHLD